jgi:hypothetical protein
VGIWLWVGLASSSLAGDGFDHAHTAFGSFLGSAVSNTGVKYDELAKRQDQLTAYIHQLETATVQDFGTEQKLAFWVNAYNALTLALILDEKQPSSIMNLDNGKVWDTRKFKVAGQLLTLNDIEHKRARPLTDGRVHAALNCASRGCPPLGPKPMTGHQTSAQLDAAARRWVHHNAYARVGETVTVSPIFDWFSADFKRWAKEPVPSLGASEGAAIRFIVQYGGAPESNLVGSTKQVSYHEYDWALNSR